MGYTEDIKDEIRRLEDEVAAKRNKIEGLKRALELYGEGKESEKEENRKKEGPKWSREEVEKEIMTLLENQGRFLHHSEIVDAIFDGTWGLDKSTFSRKLSVALSDMYRKKGKLVCHDAGGSPKQRYYWGISTWIDQEGKPMEEFFPEKLKQESEE